MGDPVASDKMVWVDIETTGLDAVDDVILEVGLLVTDLNVKKIAYWSSTIWSPYHKRAMQAAPAIVVDMHTANGLFEEARAKNICPSKAADQAVAFLMNNDVIGQPMCGSSVHTDRSFLLENMPELAEAFHYRIIDNSTLKELARRYNPRVAEQAPDDDTDHRVKTCLKNTLKQFLYYRDEFLMW